LLVDYTEPYRSQILDYLFKPNYGASLHHLKVEIGGDTNSTDGAEPSHMHTPNDQNYHRGYEWWLMEQAKARNPNITLEALEWGAPGWIGNGQFYSQDNIDYIVNFLKGAKSEHNLTIDYVGIWNETAYHTSWIKALKSSLQAHGLRTKIVAADQVNTWNIVEDMNNDEALQSAVDIVGVHYPHFNSSDLAKQSGKPLWSSEDGPWTSDWNASTPFSHLHPPPSASLPKVLNRNYISGRMTLTEIWSPVTAYYDNLPLPGSGLMYANTPWSGHYEVRSAIWVVAHTTQFTQPGWQYIDTASGYLTGGSYVTLKSPNNVDYSVIIETMDAPTGQDVTFHIAGGLSVGTIHVWRTTATDYFEQLSAIRPLNSSFSLHLEPGALYSLTTTTGQAKGMAIGAPSSPFPLPYTDHFDDGIIGRAPKYFSDQAGAFEIAECAGGRSGKCLRQIVSQKPIEWHSAINHTPVSFLGNVYWQDYEVSVDVLLEEQGHVQLLGRLEKQPQNGVPYAYILDIRHDGYWELQTVVSDNAVTTLKSGIIAFTLNTWHTLKLTFNGPNIQATIDGECIASLNDTSHVNGMVGIGGGWNKAQFDNFSVQPLKEMFASK
jgi:hypothetical protein